MTEQHHGGAAVTDTILHVLQTMQDQLNRMEAAMIPRPEYEAFKVHVEAALRDVHTNKDSSHARIEGAIAANTRAIRELDAKADESERARNAWARDVNLKVWLAILAAGLSIAVGLVARTFV